MPCSDRPRRERRGEQAYAILSSKPINSENKLLDTQHSTTPKLHRCTYACNIHPKEKLGTTYGMYREGICECHKCVDI
uniref:Uncharacterized protein n=1 Tax=Trichogramma kaykai TaxID=54128 RepID=A0ABD2WLS5_9HYME